MDFDALLQQYKDNPRRESTALLLEDARLLRYCVVFKQVKPKRLYDYPIERTWEALWDCVQVDTERLAILADDVPAVALRNLERIKGLRLVYPDGTVQQAVERLLQKRIDEALK